jgi:hypothetical protein
MVTQHHAVLCRFDLVSEFVLDESYSECEVYDRYYLKLGIDEARELVRKASLRPGEGDKQCLVVRTDFITHEAQNALLKILEEPPQSTCFVFVLHGDFILLPTLVSRFSILSGAKQTLPVGNNDFSAFLGFGYKDRLAEIDKSIKQKNTNWQRAIKVGLINYVKRTKDKGGIKGLEYTARLLFTRGASNKMLLENLALLLPIRVQ